MATVVAAMIGPLVTAVLAGLGFWLRGRNRGRQYQETLERARERVAFIQSWLEAHERFASPEQHEQARARALRDLQQAYLLVDQSTAAKQQNQPHAARNGFKRLLLLDPKHTTAARILGAFYYVSLAWLLLWVSAGILFGGGVAAINPNEPLWVSAATGFGIFVLCLATGVAPALPLYFLAVTADARTRSDRPSGDQKHPESYPPGTLIKGTMGTGGQKVDESAQATGSDLDVGRGPSADPGVGRSESHLGTPQDPG